jgi:hypothetical protein
MSTELIYPRSGFWQIRCKSDPRWDRDGQYWSLVGEPPLLVPAEAKQALDEMQAALGSGQPDDLRLTTLPYPSPKFKRLFTQHIFSRCEAQKSFQSLTQGRDAALPEITLNVDTGVLSLARPGLPPAHRIPAQFLGLFDPRQGCWQWGWVTAERGGTNPDVFKAVCSLRAQGVEHGIPELLYEQVPLGRKDDRPWFNADYMAMASANVCGSDCYMAMPVPGDEAAWSYWLVTAPGLLPPQKGEARQIFAMIQEAVQHWGAALTGNDGRAIVRAYAEARGYSIADDGADRLRIDIPAGGNLFVTFDQHGDIAGLDLPAGPESGKSSWLGRLLGRQR